MPSFGSSLVTNVSDSTLAFPLRRESAHALAAGRASAAQEKTDPVDPENSYACVNSVSGPQPEPHIALNSLDRPGFGLRQDRRKT